MNVNYFFIIKSDDSTQHDIFFFGNDEQHAIFQKLYYKLIYILLTLYCLKSQDTYNFIHFVESPEKYLNNSSELWEYKTNIL